MDPRKLSWVGRRPLSAAATVVAVVVAAHLTVVRPWYLTWGTTAEERVATYPGDALVGAGAPAVTRAITIAAPPERVWRWVAQIGQDRGGFYSYDLLENLVGCEMPEGDTLLPARQSWALGEKLWMYPPEKLGGSGYATLRVLEPGRALAFGTRALGTAPDAPEDGSWTFVVAPSGSDSSRFIARGNGPSGRRGAWLAFDLLVFEPAHFVMERRMLLGVKALAEGGTRGRRTNDIMALLFLACGLLIPASIVQARRARGHALALTGIVVASLAFELLTMLQPPLVIAVAVTVAATVTVLLSGPGTRREASLPPASPTTPA